MLPAQMAWAQESLEVEKQAASPPQSIDILVPPTPDGGLDPLAQKQCEEERDSATITREIIVCGDRNRGTTDGIWHRQQWESRYARESAYANDPQAPDVAGAGIFRGPATVGGLCILNDCPPPPALLIDVEALPPAPKESDADRIARGLAPRGQDDERGEDYSEEGLGLPPPPDWDKDNAGPAVEPESEPDD